MRAKLRMAWEWLRARGGALLAVLGGVLAVVLGIRAARRWALDAASRAEVDRLRARIADVRARRDALVTRAIDREGEVEQLEAEIDASRRRVLEIHAAEVPQDAAEVARAFRRLGYALVLAFALPGAVAAQECPPADSGAEPVVHAGAEGVWFPVESARCLLRLVQLAPEWQMQIRLLEETLSLRVEQVNDLRLAVGYGDEALGTFEEALTSETRARIEAENRLNAWWRSPAFLLVTGLVVGSVAVIAIGAAL